MSPPKQNKDGNLKTMFTKPNTRTGGSTEEEDRQGTNKGSGGLETGGGTPKEEPVTRAFMEELFTSLREDILVFKGEMIKDLKNMQSDVTDIGNRVSTLETLSDAKEEELEFYRQDLMTLKEQNMDLQLHLEDLENRSRRSNVRIRGAPRGIGNSELEQYVLRLFHHIHPPLQSEDIQLDRTHRTGPPYGPNNTMQDILTCVHHYRQKEMIMQAARGQDQISFEGATLSLYQDLSRMTLQRRRLMRPATTFLQANKTNYRWAHPFRLIFTWNKEQHGVTTLEAASEVLGLECGANESKTMERSAPKRYEQRNRWKTVTHKKKREKPTPEECEKEREAVLHDIRDMDKDSTETT